MLSDQQLLENYVAKGAEGAFGELVARHVNLVYSAALRRTGGDQELAKDAAQLVFTDLARKARSLPKDVVLAGWLHRATQFAAAQLMRSESRRKTREQELVAMNALQSESTSAWEQIRPLLDEALDRLNKLDRDALILRFFEQRSLAEVGTALGANEDAARKRVSRALEKVRVHLTRRGVSITASCLGAAISANALQGAPAGLSATLAAAAVSGTSIAIVTTISKIIAMTTLSKAAVAATLLVVTAGGVYEAHQASRLRDQVHTLQQHQAPLIEQLGQMQRERDDAAKQLAALQMELKQIKSGQDPAELLKLRGKVAALQSTLNGATETEARELVARVNKLKERLKQTPNASIPELQLLEEKDWLAASRDWKLATEAEFRQALSGLRGMAEQKFALRAQRALQKFSEGNEKQFPSHLSQLEPYFDPPLDNAILQRWEILPAGATVPGIGNKGPFITEKAPVDELLDRRLAIGFFGFSATDFLNSEIQDLLMPVYQAYSAANPNALHHNAPSQLQPFATTPEQQAAVQKLIEQSEARK